MGHDSQSQSPSADHVDHCLNCGTPTPLSYCPECGQDAVGAEVTLRQQVALFIEEVFTLESRLLPTLKLLVARPGELTRAYNAGQRARYMTPLKLYLLGSFLLFFAIGHIPAIAATQFVHFGDPEKPSYSFVFGPLRAGEERVTDEWIGERLKLHPARTPAAAWLAERVRAVAKDPPAYLAAFLDTASKVTVLLVPVHALFLWLVYTRARVRYGAHLVFSFHVHAFVYAAAAVTVALAVACGAIHVSDGWTALLLAAACGVYVPLAARTAYGDGVLLSVLKMVTVGALYGVAFVATLYLAVVVGLAQM